MPPYLNEDESLCVPREGGDDQVKLVRWLHAAGERVSAGTPVAELETSKATVELEAHRDGFLVPLVQPGERVDVGAPIARIAEQAEAARRAAEPAPRGEAPVISHKARRLMEQHGLGDDAFAGLDAVRVSDVETVLAQRGQAAAARAIHFGDETLERTRDWDVALAREDLGELRALLTELRRRMRAKFDRHVPLGTLLHDRWELAREYGFGEGSSVYAEALILGDVRVGRDCWVGPFTVLDGAASPLSIGDYSQIGSGAQIYTHNSIERTLTGHASPRHTQPTTIGRCCFISPLSMVGPGTEIGDHSFVAAQSYVQGRFSSHSYIAGNPARRVGRVVLKDGRALLERDGDT